MKLTWRGKQVTEELYRDIAKAVGEIGLEVERGAKMELYPGHGYDTGSLKRSVHTAHPRHSFKGEHSYPRGPERGGNLVIGQIGLDGVPAIAVGTGQNYAQYVHPQFQFFGAGLQRARIMARSILRRYRR